MLREVKFYARDILRGPNAKTLFGYLVFGSVVGGLIGLAFALAVIGLVTLL